jgi:hypothetical protein
MKYLNLNPGEVRIEPLLSYFKIVTSKTQQKLLKSKSLTMNLSF